MAVFPPEEETKDGFRPLPEENAKRFVRRSSPRRRRPGLYFGLSRRRMPRGSFGG